QALNAYIDPETGEVRQGTVDRDWAQAALRVYSERQATLAFFGSLFTGFNDQNSLWRYSMAVKERSIEKPELSDDEAEALVMSMWDPKNKHEAFTDRGAEAVIRGMFGGTVKPGDPS